MKSCRCPCPVCGNRSPAGEGCDRTGPSSRYEVGVLQPLLHCAQEKRWVTTDLGSASFEPCTSQAAVQNVDAETHFRVRPSPRLVCSDRPEGCVLSCLDPPATQAIPAIRVRGSGISVQGPALRLSLSPRVFTKVAEAALVPLRERGVRILNYLDDWLILAQSREQLRAHKDLVLRHLSQLGLRVNWEKSKLVPTQRISFLGMELDSVNQTARLTQERAQSVLNCLKTLSGRTAGPTETLSEAPGAYGCSCGDSAARSAPYETASALAPWPNPEVGVGNAVLTGFRLHRPAAKPSARGQIPLPSGRSAPGAGIQACGGIHGCLGPLAGEPRTTGTQC